MEREITIINSKTQKKSVITTNAETLGELKADLREAGIPYEGMTFFEGISRTELKDDDSQLPKDVMYRGQTTNNLAFMLTQPDKKIRSGAMSRMDCYNYIKSHNLGDAVKAKYGKNYTTCKTDELIEFINSQSDAAPAKSSAKPVSEKSPATCGSNDTLQRLEASIASLHDKIDDLSEKLDNMSSHVCECGEDNSNDEGGYSDAELRAMFD